MLEGLTVDKETLQWLLGAAATTVAAAVAFWVNLISRVVVRLRSDLTAHQIHVAEQMVPRDAIDKRLTDIRKEIMDGMRDLGDKIESLQRQVMNNGRKNQD